MSKLTVLIPDKCEKEIRYIVAVLLSDFLGLDYQIEIHHKDVFHIKTDEKTLELPATFFIKAEKSWLKSDSLPERPLKIWDTKNIGFDIRLTDSRIPIIAGEPECEINENGIRMGVDIFGSSFFMLSRYEEVVLKDRDGFDRFPSTASLARQEGFLMRPIVNEYLEIFWSCMKHLWPTLTRKEKTFQTVVSADVDMPYRCGAKHAFYFAKQIGGDLFRRRDFKRVLKTINDYIVSKWGTYSDEFYENLEWMMDVNEDAGNRMAFNFITEHSSRWADGCYSIDEPMIRDLIKRINERGHEIGLHPSFNTYANVEQTIREADRLRQILTEDGIEQDIIGGRQHYLRWETPTTARNWEAAGLAYDSTLSYADHAGFRCGVCYEYSFYDVVERREINLRERPLIAMDCSVIAERYMNLGNSDEALGVMKGLKESCRLFEGDFTILWHNSFFENNTARMIYTRIIA